MSDGPADDAAGDADDDRHESTDDADDPADVDTGEGDGDRILRLVGVGLVGFLVVALGVIVAAGALVGGGTDGGDVPEVEWSAERVNDTHVRIVHERGDPLNADNLIVVVGKTDRGIRRNATLRRGDALTVPATRDGSVALYWKEGDPDRRTLLARWDSIPE